MNRWERKCENRSKSRRREADKRRWSQIGKSHRKHWGALLTTGRAPPTSQGQGFISERNGPSTKYQSSWASCQVAKTKFVQQVLCSAVSLNVSTPDQKAQSHSAVYSNIRWARFTMDFTTYDERCWFAPSQSYLCPGILTKNINSGKSNDESGEEKGKGQSSSSWGLHKSRCKVWSASFWLLLLSTAATTFITLYHHVPSLYKILLSTNNTTARHWYLTPPGSTG